MQRTTWLRLLLSASILSYLIWQVDARLAFAALADVKPEYLTAVLGLVAVDRVVMIGRWVVLLRASSVAVSARSAARIFLVSSFVGSLLPAGVGADAARAYSLARCTAQGSEALASVAVDRMLGVLSIVLLGLTGLIVWTPLGAATAGGRTALAVALIVLALAGALWADRIVRALGPRRWHDSPNGGRLLRIVDAVARYRDRRRVLGLVLLLSLAVQWLRVWQAYLLGRGLGLEVNFAYYLVFMPVGLFMLLLPVSISGFGLPQGVIIWLLKPVGVPDVQAFALSTLIVLTGLAGNLPGAWLYVRAQRT